MSESKVPLPKLTCDATTGFAAVWTEEQLLAYGDARAAEARRLALMDALRRARPHLLLCADLSIVDQLDALLREYDKEKS